MHEKGGPYGASVPEVLKDVIEGVDMRATEEAREAVQVARVERGAQEAMRAARHKEGGEGEIVDGAWVGAR